MKNTFLKKVYLIKNYLNFFKKTKERYQLNFEEDKDFLLSEIKNKKIIAIDTEFDWRNTYFPILSLIQIATRKKIFIIDCLEADNLQELKHIFEKIDLIIFHSVRSDSTVLSSVADIKIENVYDIQVAEKIITKGNQEKYGSIVEKYFPINLKKSETNSNWLQRPLSQKQLNYAAEDVEFLIEIYEKQKKKIDNIIFEEILKESQKEAFLGNRELFVSRLAKLGKASKLEKKIFLWREGTAKDRNIPPSYIIKDKHLKKILKICEYDKNKKNLAELLGSEDLAISLLKTLEK
tara:strand:- start:1123 stop:1998 length:876 start_codon:yes stop_codon:yes gene_type:complete